MHQWCCWGVLITHWKNIPILGQVQTVSICDCSTAEVNQNGIFYLQIHETDNNECWAKIHSQYSDVGFVGFFKWVEWQQGWYPLWMKSKSKLGRVPLGLDISVRRLRSSISKHFVRTVNDTVDVFWVHGQWLVAWSRPGPPHGKKKKSAIS